MPTPQPTKYERIAQSHVDSFQGTYHGSIGAAAIIVSVEEPTEEAKRALTASFNALGYSPQAIGWAQTAAPGKPDASGDVHPYRGHRPVLRCLYESCQHRGPFALLQHAPCH